MPTIQLYKGGEKVAEHIAAEGAIDALEKVRRSMAGSMQLMSRAERRMPILRVFCESVTLRVALSRTAHAAAGLVPLVTALHIYSVFEGVNFAGLMVRVLLSSQGIVARGCTGP